MDRSNYNAIVSGRAGLALLTADDAVFALRPGSLSLEPRAPSDVHWLMGGSRDLEFVEDAPVDAIHQQLNAAMNREEALQLTLILLSKSYDSEAGLREEAAAELAVLFERATIREAVEDILFSKPLPPDADVAGARRAAAMHSELAAWVEELERLQPVIQQVDDAWLIAADSLGPSDPSISETEAALVRSGAFREFVRALEAGRDLGTVQFQLLSSPTLKMRLPQAFLRRLIAEWKKWLSHDAATNDCARQQHVSPEDNWSEGTSPQVAPIVGINRLTHRRGRLGNSQLVVVDKRLLPESSTEPDVYLMDADNQIVGRLALQIAIVLMGKHKADYTPNVVSGDVVVVVNAHRVRFSGVFTAAQMLSKRPEIILREAVRRMLPKNKQGTQMLKNLRLCCGSNYEHEVRVQLPKPFPEYLLPK